MCTTPRLLTPAELGAFLNLPTKSIYSLAARRGWPRYRLGRAIRFDLTAVLNAIREGGDDDPG
jgi:hypothetical protein